MLTHSHTSTGGDVCVCVCVGGLTDQGRPIFFRFDQEKIHRMQRGSLTGVGKGDKLSGKE